ncbi:TPA: hypothetical protein RM800_001074 [Yersinia enterocolitica]|uniref:hypothetical protein n=1 Tax=Yersinia enterocolitica TaxID=630 RepID=UPI002875B517|nr:hypothetical protein [Yersinia enterocolitica]EKN6259338.1 hypothetical protein [Yersinia enterocolitica]HDW8041079.1 hypothetical protein [Yersinia enterocolitica]HEF7268189.1 hypothetical protein [Yersinia enterocolitica]HEI6723348.1 hypothetical protein [Yersinia enterocolitica]
MFDLYSIPHGNKPSSELTYIEKMTEEFNKTVDEKRKYINEIIDNGDSESTDLVFLFAKEFENISQYELREYIYHSNSIHESYELARLLILNKAGASKDLITQAVKNENKYVPIYILLKNGFKENKINDLFITHDYSAHETNIKNLYQDIDTLLQKKEILQKKNTNNMPVSESLVSTRAVSALNLPLSKNKEFSRHDRAIADSQKGEFSNKKNKIDIEGKNSRIARISEEYGISKKLARLAYNNKIVFYKSISILKELTVSGVEYKNIKRIVRREFDSFMNPYSNAITDFYLEQYNYNVRIEETEMHNKLKDYLIIDYNSIFIDQPEVLHKKISEVFSLKNNEVDFNMVELITLKKSGVSNELLDSVFKGEITASDAYLIHVFKLSENETICNKLNNNELSSEGIFAYANGVRQGGNAQPEINNELAPGVQNTLSGKAESEGGISEANIGINMLENKSASDIEQSQIDEGLSKAFVLYLNLSKKTNDVIFDKINYQSLFQNERLKTHGKIINFLSPDQKYELIDISNLVILSENKASDDLLKKVANRDVLFQQAYVETQRCIIDTNIVEQRIKRENGGITAQQLIDSGTVMASQKIGGQENKTASEYFVYIMEQVAKTADEAEVNRKSVADDINVNIMSSPKVDISSEESLFPLTSQMSSVLENSEMLCSYYLPTNSNPWASLGDMLAVS